jgi:hypothetical protein
LPFWLEERPEWFTDHLMSVIPDDLIEDKALLVRVRTKNVMGIIGERRRSSLGNAIGNLMEA